LIGLADPGLPWIFGPQWGPTIPVFQVFAAFSFARAFAVLIPGTYLAIGRPQAHLAFNVFRTVVIIPTLIYLGFRRTDILLTAIVLSLIWLIQLPFFIGYLYRRINISPRDVWIVFRRILFAAAIMFTVVLLSRAVLLALGWSSSVVIVISSIVSLGLFVVLMRKDVLSASYQIRRATTHIRG